MTYPKVSHTASTTVTSAPNFPAIEEAVLSFWDADGTFQASIDQRDPVDREMLVERFLPLARQLARRRTRRAPVAARPEHRSGSRLERPVRRRRARPSMPLAPKSEG